MKGNSFEPWQLGPKADPAPVLGLIRAEFAGIEGRIDPPSSVRRWTEATVRVQAKTGEIWVIGPADALQACVFLTPKPDRLHLGKLPGDCGMRWQGHARRLIALAEARARALGLAALSLGTRVELSEDHAHSERLGFAPVGAAAHPRFDRITPHTDRKPVNPPGRD